jgi:hypothetical protein
LRYIRPGRAFVNPGLYQRNLFGSERFAVHWHSGLIAKPGNAAEKFALIGFAGDNDFAQHDLFGIQSQASRLFLFSVAARARSRKDRLNVAREINF